MGIDSLVWDILYSRMSLTLHCNSFYLRLWSSVADRENSEICDSYLFGFTVISSRTACLVPTYHFSTLFYIFTRLHTTGWRGRQKDSRNLKKKKGLGNGCKGKGKLICHISVRSLSMSLWSSYSEIRLR